MKINRILLLFTLVALVSFTACGGGGSKKGGGTKKFQSKTGWKPNDSKGWFFSQKPKGEKGWPGMVYVEGGTFTQGLVKDDVMHDWNNTPVRTQVRSYFIGETEVTNYEYREYVTWLKLVFNPSEASYKNIYNGALPDSLVWKNKLSRNDVYIEEYFRQPNYDYYPVVGVNWLQAQRYCEWLTDRANEKALMDKGVVNKDFYENDSYNQGSNHFSTEKFKYNDSDLDEVVNKEKLQKSNGIKSKNERIVAVNRSSSGSLVTKFRLPTETEWEYAALALVGNREYNLYEGKEVQVEKLRGKKGRERGNYLANFKMGRGDYSGIGGWGNDGSALTSDVKEYPSNDFGIYGMYGNVAEWCQDVYRPIIDEEGNDFNYFRGNVYQRKVQNSDGQFQKVEDATIKFDTLDDGRVIYRGLPGTYEKEIVDDARNFRDGDFQSSLEVGGGRVADSTESSFYNSPIRQFRVTDDGKVLLEKDEDNRTSEISNELRVVKGGSWKDGAYWLDPGQRRFKHEAESDSWIGFRVAQDVTGAGSDRRETKRGVNTKPPK